MLNSAVTQNTGIAIDNFDLLEGGLTQVHSLVNFLFANDNHQDMPKQIFVNLLELASVRIDKSINKSKVINVTDKRGAPLKMTSKLKHAQSLLDAIRMSDEAAGISINHQGNLLWLVSDCLEEARSELGRLPIVPQQQC
jgi:hypothetical protein